jgi:hypothetical protein
MTLLGFYFATLMRENKIGIPWLWHFSTPAFIDCDRVVSQSSDPVLLCALKFSV